MPRAAARCGGGRRSWRERWSHRAARVCLPRLLAADVARRTTDYQTLADTTPGMLAPRRMLSPSCRYRSPGVTRPGTACRSSYRPSRRHRSRCDAYSPPNYYTTGLLNIKTSKSMRYRSQINHGYIGDSFFLSFCGMYRETDLNIYNF